MSRDAQLAQLRRLVAARHDAMEREAAKAAQNARERTAEAEEQRDVWREAETIMDTYVSDRFKAAEVIPRGEQFFHSLAFGHAQKRREATIERIKSERQSAKAGEAVKDQRTKAEAVWALSRRRSGLSETTARLDRAKAAADELRDEDMLTELVQRKDRHGTS